MSVTRRRRRGNTTPASRPHQPRRLREPGRQAKSGRGPRTPQPAPPSSAAVPRPSADCQEGAGLGRGGAPGSAPREAPGRTARGHRSGAGFPARFPAGFWGPRAPRTTHARPGLRPRRRERSGSSHPRWREKTRERPVTATQGHRGLGWALQVDRGTKRPVRSSWSIDY